MRNKAGFTLIELMIVVVIIGILAAMSIPNLLAMQARAKEAHVKSNMHVMQLALEDFAVQSNGFYPDDGTSATPGGFAVVDLCPNGVYPTNPFTGAATVVGWDADPAASGEIGLNPATVNHYIIKGFGRDAMLLMQLQEGT